MRKLTELDLQCFLYFSITSVFRRVPTRTFGSTLRHLSVKSDNRLNLTFPGRLERSDFQRINAKQTIKFAREQTHLNET